MKRNYWELFSAIVVCLCIWEVGTRLNQRSFELDNVYANQVAFQAIDADTKTPVPVALQLPAKFGHQRWPRYKIIATSDTSEMQLRWLDIGPVRATVSSTGYADQVVTLDKDSESRIVVPLRKTAIVQPNAGPARGN
jgi:hypothetical protein